MVDNENKSKISIGSKIHQFRIIEHLGSGGMGDVFLAYDENLDRKVAIKALKKEENITYNAKMRFLREARVLSHLEHPNICRIYEFIEVDGQNFLVLELITGKNLRQIIKEGIDNNIKMKICLEICSVLIAAHSKGIIHRDLKPENIMLTTDGIVKVLDFGLAGIIRSEETINLHSLTTLNIEENSKVDSAADATIEVINQISSSDTCSNQNKTSLNSNDSLTKIGTIIGTPSYMSPEQARGEPATTASDIYSFGLLMQELFTEKPPLDPNLDIMSKLHLAQKGKSSPIEGLDKDLTALIERMKSLAPAQRPTAIDVMEKLKWINDKPRRRLKRLLISSAISILAILLIIMSFLAARIKMEAERANKEASRANREAEASSRVSNFLVALFKIPDPGESKGNTITARELLDKGSEKIIKELKDEPLIRAHLMMVMGKTYYNLGLYDKAKPLLEQSAKIRKEKLGENHLDYAESLANLADLLATTGDLAEAEKLYLQSINIRQKNSNPHDPELGVLYSNLGWVYYWKGDYEKAEPLCKQAVKLIENSPKRDEGSLANAINTLALIYNAKKEYDKAEPLFIKALQLHKNSYGSDHPDTATIMNNLAVLYRTKKEYNKAEQLLIQALEIREKSLGNNHILVANSLNNLAKLYLSQNLFDKAEPLFKRALEIYNTNETTDPSIKGIILYNLAALYASQKKFQQAEDMYKQALDTLENTLGKNHPRVQKCLNDYISFLKKIGKNKEAAKLQEHAKPIETK